MPGNYDGSIRIDTKVNSKGAEKDIKNMSKKIGSEVDSIDEKIQKLESALQRAAERKKTFLELGGNPKDDYMKQIEADIKRYSAALEEARAQKEALMSDSVSMPKEDNTSNNTAKLEEDSARELSKEYIEVKKQIESTEKKLNSLIERQEKFLATGGKDSSRTYKSIQYDIDQLTASLERAKAEKEAMLSDGTAYADGGISDNTAEVNRNAKAMSKAGKASIAFKKILGDVGGTAKTIGGKLRLFLGKAIEDVSDKFSHNTSKMGQMFRNMSRRFLLNMLIFNVLRKAIYGAVQAMKEGVNNLAQQDSRLNASLSQLKGSAIQLRNALGSLASPIIQAITPAIVTLCSWLTNAINLMNQFISAITGHKTWKKATAVQVDYAGALDNTASSAEKAAKAEKKQLAQFDDLNKVEFNKDSGSGGTGGGAGGGGATEGGFEELPIDIDTTWLDELKEKLEPTIKSLKRLKKALGTLEDFSYQALKDFYDLCLVPIGNWVLGEGLPRFIDGITTLINITKWDNLLSALRDLWKALTPFAVNVGEGLLWFYEKVLVPLAAWTIGDLIPAFIRDLSGALNVVNAVLNLGKPLLNWLWTEFLQPIAKWTGGAIVTILEGMASALNKLAQYITDLPTKFPALFSSFQTLGDTISTIGGVIGSFITDTISLLGQLWTNNLSPLFTDVLKGIGDIITKLSEAWDKYISPIVASIGTSVQNMYNNYLKDIFANIISTIGNIIDIVKGLWNNVLQPVIAWCSKNILPILAPILKTLWENVGGKDGAITKVLSIVKSVTGVVEKVTKAISGIVNKDWKKVWDSAHDIVKGVIKGIIELFQTMVNRAIDAINALLTPLRTLAGLGATAMNAIFGTSFSVPEPFHHVTIPGLAKGAVIPPNAPFLAMLGDQKSGTNIETPLDTMVLAFKSALQDSDMGGRGNATVIMEVDKQEFGRAVVKFGNKETQRVGISLI